MPAIVKAPFAPVVIPLIVVVEPFGFVLLTVMGVRVAGVPGTLLPENSSAANESLPETEKALPAGTLAGPLRVIAAPLYATVKKAVTWAVVVVAVAGTLAT